MIRKSIEIFKEKLRNIRGRVRVTFLQNKLMQFKDKLYKDLKKRETQ